MSPFPAVGCRPSNVGKGRRQGCRRRKNAKAARTQKPSHTLRRAVGPRAEPSSLAPCTPRTPREIHANRLAGTPAPRTSRETHTSNWPADWLCVLCALCVSTMRHPCLRVSARPPSTTRRCDDIDEPRTEGRRIVGATSFKVAPPRTDLAPASCASSGEGASGSRVIELS